MVIHFFLYDLSYTWHKQYWDLFTAASVSSHPDEKSLVSSTGFIKLPPWSKLKLTVQTPWLEWLRQLLRWLHACAFGYLLHLKQLNPRKSIFFIKCIPLLPFQLPQLIIPWRVRLMVQMLTVLSFSLLNYWVWLAKCISLFALNTAQWWWGKSYNQCPNSKNSRPCSIWISMAASFKYIILLEQPVLWRYEL